MCYLCDVNNDDTYNIQVSLQANSLTELNYH